MSNEIHLNDVGTELLITVEENGLPANISAATIKRIILKKPDQVGGVITRDAVFYTDGRDGKLVYVTVATDLDVVGLWKLQVYLEMDAGTWYSSQIGFKVSPNLS